MISLPMYVTNSKILNRQWIAFGWISNVIAWYITTKKKKLRQCTVKATKGKFEFGKKDEVFVPLGSDGLPLSNATMVTRADVDESGAFEIVQDAIDLALKRYGLMMTSPELLSAVS